MLAVCGLNEQVQILEIIVVSGDEDQGLLHRVEQMTWVPRSGQGHIGRYDHVMAHPPKSHNQGGLGRVIN
jgi:hypothetical protein